MRNSCDARGLRRLFSFVAFVLSVWGLSGTALAGTQLVTNGDFEAGDASGWLISGGLGQGCDSDWTVNTTGENGCMTIGDNASPAAYCALDGDGPKEHVLSQIVHVPSATYAGALSFRYAATWDVGGTARELRIAFYSTDGALLSSATAVSFAGSDQSPWSAVSVDVSATLAAHRGEDLVLYVSVVVPESFTGPGGIGIDDVSVIAESYRVLQDGATVAPSGALALGSAGKSGAETWTFDTNASGGSVDRASGLYRAGSTPDVDDVLLVTDAAGKSARATLHVGAGVSIAPAAPPTVSPRGSLDFVASGGSGDGYTFAVTVNRSGGSVSAQGHYTAGPASSVQDTLTATDSLGNVRTVVVRVGPGVSVTPGSASVVPRASIAFAAAGGSGEGYVWSMVTAPSGGRIDAATGLYQAGYVARVADIVMATDSLGNSRTVSISVGGALAISPPRIERLTGETVDFTATGGSGQGRVWAIATNGSGCTLDPVTGAYRAGFNPGGDTITLRDSIGNTAVAYIVVNGRPSTGPTVPPSTGGLPKEPRTVPPSMGLPPAGTLPETPVAVPLPGTDAGGCSTSGTTPGSMGGSLLLLGLTLVAVRRNRRSHRTRA